VASEAVTDLESDQGGAPICDPVLFSKVIELANRWKKDCYDPGHDLRDLLPDNSVVINLGPEAIPRQVREESTLFVKAFFAAERGGLV
jgi:hypothetical protein